MKTRKLMLDDADRSLVALALNKYRRELSRTVEDFAALGVDATNVMRLLGRVDGMLEQLDAKVWGGK